MPGTWDRRLDKCMLELSRGARRTRAGVSMSLQTDLKKIRYDPDNDNRGTMQKRYAVLTKAKKTEPKVRKDIVEILYGVDVVEELERYRHENPQFANADDRMVFEMWYEGIRKQEMLDWQR